MTAEDRFAHHSKELNSPSDYYFAITKGDTAEFDFPVVSRAIRIGIAGDVMVMRMDGVVVPFLNCYPGETLPLRAVRVMATGTTAGGLVALC